MPYRLTERVEKLGRGKYVKGDKGGRRRNYKEEHSYLGVYRILEFATEYKVIGVEVYRENKHKYGNYYLLGGGCRSEAVVLKAEAAGARR